MTSASDTDKLDWQLWECPECLRIAIESDYEGVQFYQQEKEGREQVCLRCLGSGKVYITYLATGIALLSGFVFGLIVVIIIDFIAGHL